MEICGGFLGFNFYFRFIILLGCGFKGGRGFVLFIIFFLGFSLVRGVELEFSLLNYFIN